jgi:hypothetical protein
MLHICVCVCVLGRVGVCIRVRVCSLAHPARNAYAPYCDVICCTPSSTTFFEIISQTARFSEKKVIERKMLSETFLIIRRIQPDVISMKASSHYSRRILMKPEISC